jgi:hypothetical protein
MAHKGIYQYGGDEGGNVALGQLGFKVLTSAGNTGDGQFVAFKVLGGAADVNVDIDCTCHQGDELSINNVLTGEIVWGAFKKITISNVGTGIQVLCYYG